MGSPAVVVGFVPGEDRAQMPFTEDQHPVGDLGSGGEDEAFRITVRSRTPGRYLRDWDGSVGQDRVNDAVN
jgi:hypothetical protein